MHERKPVHCLLFAPSHVIQSCHWRSVRSSLLNFQYLKQANFPTQVSRTQVVLNQWNSVSRDTTHVQAGLQHPHHFWGSTKRVSFTSLFSFSGPTLTWTFPLSINSLKLPQRLPLRKGSPLLTQSQKKVLVQVSGLFYIFMGGPEPLPSSLFPSHLLCLIPVYRLLPNSTLPAHSSASKWHLPSEVTIYHLKFM